MIAGKEEDRDVETVHGVKRTRDNLAVALVRLEHVATHDDEIALRIMSEPANSAHSVQTGLVVPAALLR
jgi:hypothetical protein